jgi:DNA end-binding protein Ku
MALLRVRDKAIVLQTMLWPDEVREPDFEILDTSVDLRPQELKMAASLVESLGADFDPSDFHDEYRDAVVALIERKKTTGDARPAPVAPAPVDDAGDSMTDLLTALQRSVEAAKAASGPSTSRGAAEEPAPAKPARRSSKKKASDEEEKPAARKRTRKPA